MSQRGTSFFQQQELTSVKRAREALTRRSFEDTVIFREARAIERGVKGMKWGQRKGKARAEGPSGHQVGTTQSGKPIPHFNHPLYSQPEKLAKYNGPVSPRQAHGGDGARMLKNRLQGWSKQDHLDAAKAHENMYNAAKQQWGKVADSAAQKTFGRPFRMTDYQTSGIGSDKFPEPYKNKLRELAHSMAGHSDATSLHNRIAQGRFPQQEEAQESFGDRSEMRNRVLGRSVPTQEHGVKGMKWGQKKQQDTRQDKEPPSGGGGAPPSGGGEGTGVTKSGKKRGNIPDPGERDEHQGWHNWETWHTALLIDNDQQANNQAMALGKRGLHFQQKGNFNIDRLALAFKNNFNKFYKETADYAKQNAEDSPGGGWQPPAQANWREIAENYMDRAKEEEDYAAKKKQ